MVCKESRVFKKVSPCFKRCFFCLKIFLLKKLILFFVYFSVFATITSEYFRNIIVLLYTINCSTTRNNNIYLRSLRH